MSHDLSTFLGLLLVAVFAAGAAVGRWDRVTEDRVNAEERRAAVLRARRARKKQRRLSKR